MRPSILSICTSGGCGAKIGAGELSALLAGLPVFPNPNLLVGFDHSDDAAVYQISPDTALIATVDFFSPMLDEPRTFGRIAAANALSDVYAMGGQPVLALNLICFPEAWDKAILADILAGGSEKMAEAGVSLGGGHSIYDKEPKYGLSVTGVVHPQRVIRNNTPQVGHALILTKPLGVGLILSAHRNQAAELDHVAQAVTSMERLNRDAADCMSRYAVSACTDVTGFGLCNHLLEMCGDTVSAVIHAMEAPCLPSAIKYAGQGWVTSAAGRNRAHAISRGISSIEALSTQRQELFFDPQTSGGLLIAVPPEQAESLLADIRVGDSHAAIIGEIVPKQTDRVLFV